MAMDLSMSTGALQYDLWVSFAVKVSGFNWNKDFTSKL
jgi:hypothetical protein